MLHYLQGETTLHMSAKSLVFSAAAVLLSQATNCSAAETDKTASRNEISLDYFGAKCNGDGRNAEADTAAAESAAATGKNIYIPSNNYCIFLRPIRLLKIGQSIIGDGAQASKVLIYRRFGFDEKGVSKQGVINLEASGQSVHGIGITFSQPSNPSLRKDLITYQPAILARQPATTLSDLLIVGATTCIDMAGGANTGNSALDSIETGCYDYGIKVDGALDTVSIRGHHHFPFQMNTAQQTIFKRVENVAIDLGRVDDYSITGGLCLGSTCLSLHDGAQGGPFGTITGYDFDGAAIGIHMQTANASLVGSALTFSSGSGAQHAIVQTSGRLVISGSSFFTAASTVLDVFRGGIQLLNGNEWNLGIFDSNSIDAFCPIEANSPASNARRTSACRLVLTSNVVERDPSVSFLHPWLSSRGNEVVIASSNSLTSTSNNGPFISIENDKAGNRVTGNSSPGWSNYLHHELMSNQKDFKSNAGNYYGN